MTTALDAAGRVAAFGYEEMSDEELDILLWEYTPFPLSTWQETIDAIVRVLEDPEEAQQHHLDFEPEASRPVVDVEGGTRV